MEKRNVYNEPGSIQRLEIRYCLEKVAEIYEGLLFFNNKQHHNFAMKQSLRQAGAGAGMLNRIFIYFFFFQVLNC